MAYGALEGMRYMIMNFLGIPPGASWRKESRGSNSDVGGLAQVNDLLNSIVDITSDDVTIGSDPFYYISDVDLTDKQIKITKELVSEFNSIAKWAAVDLLKRGISIYRTDIRETEVQEGEIIRKVKQLILLPYIKEVKIYMTAGKRLVITEEESGEVVSDVITFINYDKNSLTEADASLGKQLEEEILFEVTPTPVQLNNIQDSIGELVLTERSIYRYRKQLSRIVRLITVDCGIAQGDIQQEVIDNISSAINADSLSLSPSYTQDFDDAIPVLPHRKGIGKPEYTEHIPSANISELADLDYLLNKIYLATRFPKSYADFSQEMGQTAVSTIRGDIRYNRLVTRTRTLLEGTVNQFLQENELLSEKGVRFILTELPTPEDEDVVAALEQYGDFTKNIHDFVIGDSTTKQEATLKLDLLSTLLGGSSNLKAIQNWLVVYNKYIEDHFVEEVTEDLDDLGGDDFDDLGGDDFDDLGGDDSEGSYTNSVEVLDPQ